MNTEQVPLTEEDLQLLRSVVRAAIDLHEVPTLPSRVIEAITNLYQFLVDTKERLEKLTATTRALKGLVFQLGEAALALKELLDILGVTMNRSGFAGGSNS